jgi:peptidoglycan-associated lipoprotein
MKYAKTAVRMVTAAMLVAALAACASKPKRVVVADTGASGMPMPPPSTAPEAFPAPPTGAVMGGPARPGSVQDFVINAGDRVYFDYDSFEIRSDATPVLDAQANWLQRYPGVRVRIEGNADERGTREYNFALGSRRAQAVADYLSGRGVNRGRISTVSYGKERPIDPGSGEDAWSRNRNGHTSIVEGAR